MVTHAQHIAVFAQRLRTARELIGISQMELGVRAGIDESSASARINQYERGKHTPDITTAQNLARVLGVPPAYFYADDDGLADLIAMYGRLTLTKKKALHALVSSFNETL